MNDIHIKTTCQVRKNGSWQDFEEKMFISSDVFQLVQESTQKQLAAAIDFVTLSLTPEDVVRDIKVVKI